MIIQSTNQNLIEKVLRNPDGRLVRATFAVYEHDGRVKARLVRVVFLDEAPALSAGTLALGGVYAAAAIFGQTALHGSIPTPYYHSNLLYISGSQPRAPTHF